MGKKHVKYTLNFNEEKRKEFLTGFHKRKEERRKHARVEISKQLKEERIQIRKNKRKDLQNRLDEITNIKLAHNIEPTCLDIGTDVVDLPQHSVTVVESELFDPVNNIFIGDNTGSEETKSKPTNPVALRKTKEKVNKLEKTQQKLHNKKKRVQTPKASKATRKYLKKKTHLKGKHK